MCSVCQHVMYIFVLLLSITIKMIYVNLQRMSVWLSHYKSTYAHISHFFHFSYESLQVGEPPTPQIKFLGEHSSDMRDISAFLFLHINLKKCFISLYCTYSFCYQAITSRWVLRNQYHLQYANPVIHRENHFTLSRRYVGMYLSHHH